MKRIVLLLATFFVICLSTAASADDWRALVTDAYSKADLVMSGTVQSVDNQTAVDGGHVYRLQVTDRNKGSAGEDVLIRAGGFFYTVPLEVDESVLVFLKSVNGARFSAGAPAYSLVEVASLRPMVFKVSGARVKAVDNRLGPEFDNVTGAEINDFLSSLKP
jgi:hypothetical protein